MFCKNCGSEIGDNDIFCPTCGAKKEPPATNSTLMSLFIICGILTIVLSAVFIYLFTDKTLPFTTSGQETATNSEINQSVLEGNPYQSCFATYGDYILPQSDSMYKCYNDIREMSNDALLLAKHEIYARHGKSFDDTSIQEYFNAHDWYLPSNAEFELSVQEQSNVSLLEVTLAVRNDTLDYEGNKYLMANSAEYMIPESNSVKLYENDLFDYTKTQLTIARNELLARHGYVFKDSDLRTYFYSKPWYVPSVLGTEFNFSVLNDVETKNVSMVKRVEKVASNDKVLTIPDISYKDKYTKALNDGENCYHIPTVNLSVVKSINDKIYSEYKWIKDEIKDPDSLVLLNVAYSVGQYDYAASVVMKTQYDADCEYYKAYNFSTVTGKALSAEEIFALYGLTEEEGRDNIKTALTDFLKYLPDEYSQSTYKKKTLATKNINAAVPFINEYGNLCFYAEIYSPAGAETYEYAITMSGYMCDISCYSNH
ncbi:MAG: YARHG domain-containing protein [Clostridia bacterium]|nr:YARHG domain-containing protein [Clostridia bacterium]